MQPFLLHAFSPIRLRPEGAVFYIGRAAICTKVIVKRQVTMRRILYTAICLITAAAAASAQLVPRETVERIKDATVYIEVKRVFSLSGEVVSTSGTGFFISSNGHIATSYHVVEPMVSIYNLGFPAPVTEIKAVRNSGNPNHKVLDAKLLFADKENDLAILGTDVQNSTPLEFGSPDELIETTPVWIFGFPFGETFSVLQRGPEITVSRGTISAMRHDDRGHLESIQIDAGANPGNSGGPVVDDSGNVLGIMKQIIQDTRMSFAVPVTFLKEMTKNVSFERSSGLKAQLTILSSNGGQLYLDWDSVGSLPVRNLEMTPGWKTLTVMRKGHESWFLQDKFLQKDTIRVDLRLQGNISLISNRPKGPAPQCFPKTPELEGYSEYTKKSMFAEDFANQEVLADWEQYTDGDEKRTWFVDGGKLQQFESNENLHAIHAGDTSWQNYMVEARVRITDSHDDSRAGIVFRATDEGFYLLRIHRGTNIAQLAYHSTRPFGWFVIKQKQLSRPVADIWHTLTAVVSGDTIHAYVDGECVFSSFAQFGNKGRVGFYSVESIALFDNLAVYKLPDSPPRSIANKKPEIISYWFTDYFNLESTWWFQYTSEDTLSASPWQFSDAGVAQPYNDDVSRFSEFTRYRFDDFSMDLILSLGQGRGNGKFSIIFRKDENGHAELRFSKQQMTVSVISVKRGEQKVLYESALPMDFFDNTDRLLLAVHGKTLLLSTTDGVLMQFADRNLPEGPGKLLIETLEVQTVLHQMTISSSEPK